MWRTVITWYPIFFFFFLTIQAYLFWEYLHCGEQSSPGFPFFFFKLYKHIYLGNTYNVANSHHLVSHFFFFREYLQCGEHDLVFSIPVWQTVPGIFFFFFNYYLYDSPVQPASRSHPRGNRKTKKKKKKKTVC